MRSALLLPPLDEDRRLLLRRSAILLVVLLVHILGVIGLIMLAPEYVLPPKKPEPTVFTLTDPADRAAAKSSPRSRAQSKTTKAATPSPPQEEKPPPPLAMVMLDSHIFASTNIGALPQSATASAPADDGGAPGGKGAGPNGERLYNAEWYREPTEAETGPYFRSVRSTGWGDIACRTIERWHVEDCRELDESPVGSGISRAARQAAWQFLVRPPRIGGKLLIGSWVRIRYTITPSKDSDAQR